MEVKEYVSHPWTDCDYEKDTAYACLARAVFGIQEMASPQGRRIGDGYQACVEHVGEMCVTDKWWGGQWKVWTL